MPAKSEKQRRLFGIAKAIKEGRTPASYSRAGAKISKTVSAKSIKDFAKKSKKHKLPKRSFVYKK